MLPPHLVPQAKRISVEGGDLPLPSTSAGDPGTKCRTRAGGGLVSRLKSERDKTSEHTRAPGLGKASGLCAWGDSFEDQPDAAVSCPLNLAVSKALTYPSLRKAGQRRHEPLLSEEQTWAKRGYEACPWPQGQGWAVPEVSLLTGDQGSHRGW